MSTDETPGPFETFLEEFEAENGRPAIDFWVGAHSHSHPDDHVDGRGLVAQKFGVTFMQIAALTHYHSGRTPMSWMLSFTEDSDQVDIGNYIHRAPFYNHIPKSVMNEKGVEAVGVAAPEGGLETNGWYEPNASTVTLRHTFVAPPPDPRPPLN